MNKPAQTDSLTISRLKRWSVYFSGMVVLFGSFLTGVSLLVQIGWRWNIGVFRNYWPRLSLMNPVTAMTFLLSGLAIMVLSLRRKVRKPVPGLILVCLPFSIGVLRLLSVWWPDFWRVDYLLYARGFLRDARLHSTSLRVMSPVTATAFILLSAAAWLLMKNRRWAILTAQSLAVCFGMIGLFTLICYLYGVGELYLSSVTIAMAAPSTVCFLLLSFAILFAAPGKGVMRQITGPYTGGVMSRRFIPFALIVPIVLCRAALFSPWRDSVSIQFSATILITTIIFISLTFIAVYALLLNRRDISNLRVQGELQASEERYRLLIGSVKDHAIAMLDRMGRVVSWNEASEAMTGYRADEIIGRPNSVFYAQSDIDGGAPQANLNHIAQRGHVIREGWQTRKDGNRYWAEISATAIYGARGQVQGFSVIVRDMTERRRTQEKLAYQSRLMEDSSDAIFAVDADFNMVSFNKAAETLFGYPDTEVIGKQLNDVLRNPMSHEQRSAIRQELLDMGYWKGLVTYHTRNKVPLDIAISISRTRDDRGGIDGYIMVCRDMTERLRAEAKLRQFNEELERQVEEKTAELVRSNTELRELTSRLQRVREDERGGIAREIHDELGQQLTGLKMDLFWIAKRLDAEAPDQAKQKLRATIGLLDETIRTVRRIATDLRPSILDDLGLIAAIEWQSQEFEKRAGIPTVFRSTIPEMDFPPDMAIGMFRICQESLTNVARHAAASTVRITLDPVAGGVRMAITDDGRGLDPQKTGPKTLGLLGMKERALMMGGRLEIGNNGEKTGLQLVVTVPLPPVLT